MGWDDIQTPLVFITSGSLARYTLCVLLVLLVSGCTQWLFLSPHNEPGLVDECRPILEIYQSFSQVYKPMLGDNGGSADVEEATSQEDENLALSGGLALEYASSDIDRLRAQTVLYERRLDTDIMETVMQCPYTAAIVYLVKGSEISNVLLSLSLLWRNVPMHCSYPIVLFHDGYFSQPYVRRAFKDKVLLLLMGRMEADGHGAVLRALEAINGIEFIELKPTLPKGISSDVQVVDPVFAEVWPGYHHMCQFFFSGIFDHPRIRNLDYYLRLDTDSFIVDRMSYDPIAVLHRDKKKYGFVAVATDPPFVTEGFFPFVRAFAARRPNVRVQMEKNGWKFPESQRAFAYQNNFEVAHVPSFRTPEVRQWVEAVNANPLRIFKYRWGDAPLRFATVQMFFDVEIDVEMYCDMPYYHQVHIPSCSSSDNSTVRKTH